MKSEAPKIELKQAGWDMLHGSYLLADFSEKSSEQEGQKWITNNSDELVIKAAHMGASQVQLKFPIHWSSFLQFITSLGYIPCLVRLETNPQAISPPHNIIEGTFDETIASFMHIQQMIHFELDRDFYKDPRTPEFSRYISNLRKMLSEDLGILFVAKNGREVIGCSIGEKIDSDSVYVNELFVAEKNRGTGLGSLLLRAVENFAVGQKAAVVWLTVSVRNKSALHFYEKYGLRPTALICYKNGET